MKFTLITSQLNKMIATFIRRIPCFNEYMNRLLLQPTTVVGNTTEMWSNKLKLANRRIWIVLSALLWISVLASLFSNSRVSMPVWKMILKQDTNTYGKIHVLCLFLLQVYVHISICKHRPTLTHALCSRLMGYIYDGAAVYHRDNAAMQSKG